MWSFIMDMFYTVCNTIADMAIAALEPTASVSVSPDIIMLLPIGVVLVMGILVGRWIVGAYVPVQRKKF